MAKVEAWFAQDLKKPVPVRYLDGSFFNEDAAGSRIGVVVYSDGEAVNLAGSITGYCVRSDGTTVPVSGTRSSNRAYIDIPQSALAIPGPLTVTIKNTESSVITTLCAVVGIVIQSRTGVQVDPGQTVTDWTNQISAQIQACQDAADNIGATIAVAYSDLTFPVEVGTYTIEGGNLYCCKTRIAESESFTASHWRQTKVCDEIHGLTNAVVRHDEAQTLTDAQKAQARANIGAASVGDVSDVKSAVDNISYVGKTITDGWYIDSTNGNAVSTAAWAYATFNVEGLDGETAIIATKLYNDHAAGWVVLLKDGTVSASGTTENATITLPENVDVVKISCLKSSLSPENIKLDCDYSKQLAYKKEIPDIDPLVEQLYEEETVLYATYKDNWDKGYLNENGGVTLTSNWRTCGFIEIPSDSTITYKLSMYTGVYYIAFYDANQQYISNSAIQSTVTNNWQNKYTTGTAVIPNGAKYVKFSFRADNDSLYNDQSVTVTYARISAIEDDISALENKEKITARVLIIGDSYSANSDKWIAPMMQEFSDDSSYISLAVSSATVRDQSNDRTTYPYTSRPSSSNTTPNTNTLGCQIAKLKRLMTGTDLDTGETAIYQTESEYPNVIIIQGGENDWKDSSTANYITQYEVAVENVYYSRWGNVSQGTVYVKPDVETVDRTTFAGAYRYLMDELYALFPKAQYFFTTTSPVAPHQNPVVALRREVAEQQRFCANLNCVSVIDWQAESQMSIIVNSVSSGDGTQANPYVVTPMTQDSTDGLHPTEYGGKKLGKLAAHIINSRFMKLS